MSTYILFGQQISFSEAQDRYSRLVSAYINALFATTTEFTTWYHACGSIEKVLQGYVSEADRLISKYVDGPLYEQLLDLEIYDVGKETYRAEDGVCLAVSSIPFQHQRRVTLQRADGNHIVFCVEKNKRLSVGQTYRVYLPTGTVVSEVKKAHLPQHYALTVEKIEIDSICIVPDASEKPVEKSQQKPYN